MLERTLVKHDALQRGLAGEIIKRFEQRGFRIAGIKMILPSQEELSGHYADDERMITETGERTIEHWKKTGKPYTETAKQIGCRIRNWNISGLAGAPIIAIIFEGYHAVEIGRKIVGHTEPRQAVSGTIRGDFSVESYAIGDARKRTLKNLVHASGTKAEAEREIKVWFKKEEMHDYEKHDWKVIHP
ncbi:MAG: nucleoside-diphosphate kinase [Candidatus Woesearchaeota archaeon]